MSGAIQVYRRVNEAGRAEWRWRLVAANDRIVAASSEGFFSRGNAIRNARLAHRLMEKALGK